MIWATTNTVLRGQSVRLGALTVSALTGMPLRGALALLAGSSRW